MKVIQLVLTSFGFIQIERIRWSNSIKINNEAPITCMKRINQPVFIFTIT